MLSGWFWVVLWNANSTPQDRVLLLAECSLSAFTWFLRCLPTDMVVSLLLTGVRGKLVIPQLVQKFTAFWINQRFRSRIHKMLSPVHMFGHVTPVHTHPVCYRCVSVLSHLFRGLTSGVVPCGFPTKLCIHLLSLWCVQHAPPISSLVLSPWSYLTRTTSPEASHLISSHLPSVLIPSPDIFRRILSPWYHQPLFSHCERSRSTSTRIEFIINSSVMKCYVKAIIQR